MRLKTKFKQEGTCGDGEYCVQLYSRSASLVSEFCLDMQENNVTSLDAAEQLLRETMAPCDFATTTVTLIGAEGTDSESVLKFAPK